MSELSEFSGECDDCGEYLDDCICETLYEKDEQLSTCPTCWNREDFCDCPEENMKPKTQPKTKTDFEAILTDVEFLHFDFHILQENDRCFLQASFTALDTVSREMKTQKTRKWMLSPWMTKSEVVGTAFKCVITAVEHEARESFTYKEERIYSPHYDVDALAELCRAGKFDERDDWYAEENKSNDLAEKFEFAARHTE